MNTINLLLLNNYIKKLKEILEDGKLSWEVKYDLIFNVKRISFLESIGISHFTWYDPDTSYEEDVRAYVDSFIATYVCKIRGVNLNSKEDIYEKYLSALYPGTVNYEI